MLWLIPALTLLALVAAATLTRAWIWWPVTKRRVIVQTDGPTFDAVLMSRRGPLLVLADVVVRIPGAEPRSVDGQVVIERSRVAWLQVVS